MKNLFLIFSFTFLFMSCVSHKTPYYTKKVNIEKSPTYKSSKRFTKKFIKDLKKKLTKEEMDIINNTNIIFEYNFK